MEEKKEKTIEAELLAEIVGESIRFRLACDPKNPLLLFDKINEYEIALINQAGGDLKKIKIASDFVDDLRSRAKSALMLAGIDIEKIKNEIPRGNGN
jgi:hypothetical protein